MIQNLQSLASFKSIPIYKIIYKILLLTFKCLSGEAPTFLQEIIRWYIPTRTLGSSSVLLLEVRRCKCKTLGTRSFGYA